MFYESALSFFEGFGQNGKNICMEASNQDFSKLFGGIIMKNGFKKSPAALWMIGFLLAGITTLYSSSVLKQNMVDLISLSEMIIVGKIVSVTDGFDANNVPYTEVSIEVKEAIKGNVGKTYTFRQFGLLKPRDMGNGYINLNVTPDGWPTYQENKEVLLFLYKAAALTGLRTTVGLFQGKFNIENGQISNTINNMGLFEKVSVKTREVSEAELSSLTRQEQEQLLKELEAEKLVVNKLLNAKGPVDAEIFISFVRKAVNENWIGERRMRHE
jgi:hypothetical protein